MKVRCRPIQKALRPIIRLLVASCSCHWRYTASRLAGTQCTWWLFAWLTEAVIDFPGFRKAGPNCVPHVCCTQTCGGSCPPLA